MNIKSTAIFTPVDHKNLFVKRSDLGVCVSGATPQSGYLEIEPIIQCALANSCDAVHPGYGFLSQSPEFAEQCIKNGITWIGPSPEAMRSMGIKSHAKDIMRRAGVPVLPGYHGPDQSLERLYAEAIKIGFPVMIKPVRGGGGKGMRVVHTPEDFHLMVESSRRESIKSFNDDELLVEKFIVNPRHVEVQVFGDSHGNVVHFYERDCSVQRRHQKVIEEAPAPNISEETRTKLGDAAILAAKAVGYCNAGTVEFILNCDQSFYFMEMNTRLQVEHPVSESITGVDFVQLQFRIARGEKINYTQSDIRARGHSFEVRLCAEDPENDFLPSSGRISHIQWPPSSLSRVDSGYVLGDTISSYYDSLIAKVIVHDENREKALTRLRRALDQTRIQGLPTNLGFLKSLAYSPEFERVQITTGFIEDNKAALFQKEAASDEIICAGAILLYSLPTTLSKKNRFQDFRVNGEKRVTIGVLCNGSHSQVRIDTVSSSVYKYRIQVNGSTFDCDCDIFDASMSLRLDSKVWNLSFSREASAVVVVHNNSSFAFELTQPSHLKGTSSAVSKNTVLCPMTGTVIRVDVKSGDTVKKGDVLAIIEAMKMEHVLRAPTDGVVKNLSVQSSQNVKKDHNVCSIEPFS